MTEPRSDRSGILDARVSRSRTGGPSFSFKHRLTRALWALVWTIGAAWTPPPLHKWRVFLLRCFGARIEWSARIYGTARIWYPANLAMGRNAVIGPRVNCYSMAPITIGPDAIISQGAHLCSGTHDVDDPHFQIQAFPITIGPKAWIAAEAFVGPGVEIHEGAVLGARGVAVKDLAAWTIYAGNPARPIRDRLQSAGEPV
jgi:putative colanic acid biosynthesis acetyltransferase WcaF